ncbi:MAG: disulfide bond formation protein B [Neptuniibacter sp.]
MAKKEPRYRRLNALGFFCCLSFFLYLFFCLQTSVTGHATPFASLIRLTLLSNTLLFFIALIHNPYVSGQRFYSFINMLLTLSGIGTAANHLWIQAKPELINASLLSLCEKPFENLMAQQPTLPDKLVLLYNLSGNCTAESLAPLPIGFPAQTLLIFVLLFLLCWKTFIHRPKAQGMFL